MADLGPEVMKMLGLNDKALLTELSKQTGGIPDFAKEALKKVMPPEDVDEADKAGKKPE